MMKGSALEQWSRQGKAQGQGQALEQGQGQAEVLQTLTLHTTPALLIVS